MCFTLEWLEHLLILAVVVISIVAILQLIINYVLAKITPSGMFADAISIISQVIKIVIWAIIIIAIIYFCFAMISCLWSYAGGGFSLMPHGR
jgi:hypothetical protein